MVRVTWVVALWVLSAVLAGCGSEAAGGGSGSGGGGASSGESEQLPCDESTAFCANIAYDCQCVDGPKRVSAGCVDRDGDGEDDVCTSHEEMCARYDCTAAEPTGAGAGGAPTTGSVDPTAGSGGDPSTTTGGDPSTGSGTTMHPECEAYADGQCACGYQGQCADGQREELVDYCNGFFDTAYMQCQIGCATGGGTCTEKSECSYACE